MELARKFVHIIHSINTIKTISLRDKYMKFCMPMPIFYVGGIGVEHLAFKISTFILNLFNIFEYFDNKIEKIYIFCWFHNYWA